MIPRIYTIIFVLALLPPMLLSMIIYFIMDEIQLRAWRLSTYLLDQINNRLEVLSRYSTSAPR